MPITLKLWENDLNIGGYNVERNRHGSDTTELEICTIKPGAADKYWWEVTGIPISQPTGSKVHQN